MKISILGATGSVGKSTLDLATAFPDQLEVTALTCARRVAELAPAIKRHLPKLAVVYDETARRELNALLKDMAAAKRPEILLGVEGGYLTAATGSGAETVVSAIVGSAGLPPTLAAIKAGLRVVLANKESLVLGGDLINAEAKRSGSVILPADSEHSAIFQVLRGCVAKEVRRLILTASGGPFRGWKSGDLANVTAAQALNHPRWRMGPKISCDSATMMNKGLELIEAHHLFEIPYERLEAVIHPESLVHSIVEYQDGSQLAQMSFPDMRLPLAYALSHPERWPLLKSGSHHGLNGYAPLDLVKSGRLTFEAPDHQTFPAIKLAVAAGQSGGTAPAILSGANEAAVGLFLDGKISFSEIMILVEQTLLKTPQTPAKTIDDVLAADIEASRKARELAGKNTALKN